MSADFVKLIQTFAADLNATDREHQRLAKMMFKWLIAEPAVRAERSSMFRRSTRPPRPAQSAPHLISG
jgi:hypothetical protein